MATANWNKLYERFYRKRDVYEMEWEGVRFDESIVSGAPFGGPIAVVRDMRKLVKAGPTSTKPVKMNIFSSSGALICSFTFQPRNLITMGWSHDEKLVCVLDDGTVMLFSIHGERVGQFPLGRECKESGVAEVIILGSELVARTNSNEFIGARNFNNPQTFVLAQPEISMAPTSIAAISSSNSASGQLEVFVATTTGTIIVIDETKAEDQLVTSGPFTRMAVSPTCEKLCCFSASGTLYAMSTDFQRNLSEFGTKSRVPPLSMAWCGEDAMVLYWESILLLIGTFGHFVKFTYDAPLLLVRELDGVRIITQDMCEILQLVPESTEKIFGIGSVAPAALLYDAAEAFERKNPRADDNIRSIRRSGKLQEAVDHCLDAAVHELDISAQKRLLKAASYGKLFLAEYGTDHFVDSCRALRVLNAVRHYSIGLAITFDQFQRLSPEVLIDRLISRHHHLLAYRICAYFRMRPDKVLIHWACAKVVSDDADDKTLASEIVSKLSGRGKISFAPVAKAAFHSRRTKLATLLLEHEPRAADQVPLLISMKEDELALEKAIDSGDTELIYMSLLHIKRTRSKADLFSIIKDKPIACSLLIAYCKENDAELLKNCYYYLQKPRAAAHLAIREAYRSTDWESRLRGFELALQFYQEDKDDPFFAKITEEQLKLFKLQRHKEMEIGGRVTLVDKSVSDLLREYIRSGQLKHASKVQQIFKVPAKRFWHIQVQLYAETRDWEQLFKLIDNKKAPPIGYLPFVEACVKQHAFTEAAKYIAKLQDDADKMEWYCNIGFWREAADVAIRAGNVDAMQTIRLNCRDRSVEALLDRSLADATTRP